MKNGKFFSLDFGERSEVFSLSGSTNSQKGFRWPENRRQTDIELIVQYDEKPKLRLQTLGQRILA